MASFRPTIDVADYRVAFSFMLAAIVLPVAINNDVLRTRLYRLQAAASAVPARYRALERRSLAVTAVFGIGCAAVLFVAADPLVDLIYGSGYEHGLRSGADPRDRVPAPLPQQLVGQRPRGPWPDPSRRRRASDAAGRERRRQHLGDPAHGPRGAAVVTVCTEVLGLVLYGVVLSRARAGLRSAS